MASVVVSYQAIRELPKLITRTTLTVRDRVITVRVWPSSQGAPEPLTVSKITGLFAKRDVSHDYKDNVVDEGFSMYAVVGGGTCVTLLRDEDSPKGILFIRDVLADHLALSSPHPV